jgi:hypothetical protein
MALIMRRAWVCALVATASAPATAAAVAETIGRGGVGGVVVPRQQFGANFLDDEWSKCVGPRTHSARTPTSPRSTGSCAIWGCIRSSLSGRGACRGAIERSGWGAWVARLLPQRPVACLECPTTCLSLVLACVHALLLGTSTTAARRRRPWHSSQTRRGPPGSP